MERLTNVYGAHTALDEVRPAQRAESIHGAARALRIRQDAATRQRRRLPRSVAADERAEVLPERRRPAMVLSGLGTLASHGRTGKCNPGTA